MELKQGDKLKLATLTGGTPVIIVNNGAGWNDGPGCLICLRPINEDTGEYEIGSIIKEDGPAVSMGTANAVKYLQRLQK